MDLETEGEALPEAWFLIVHARPDSKTTQVRVDDSGISVYSDFTAAFNAYRIGQSGYL